MNTTIKQHATFVIPAFLYCIFGTINAQQKPTLRKKIFQIKIASTNNAAELYPVMITVQGGIFTMGDIRRKSYFFG